LYIARLPGRQHAVADAVPAGDLLLVAGRPNGNITPIAPRGLCGHPAMDLPSSHTEPRLFVCILKD